MAVYREIAPGDRMYAGHREHYFGVGEEALRLIQREVTGDIRRILDFGCGHGRVMRHLRAAYSEAEIVACDVDPDCVSFCAEQLRAVPIISDTDPSNIRIEGQFDIIWSGSVFTHVDNWDGFLALLRSVLGGVFIFTTAGDHVIDLMRGGERKGLTAGQAHQLIADYERTGFGYQDYAGQNYGLARATPQWIRGRLERHRFRVLDCIERGWDDRQDVFICQ